MSDFNDHYFVVRETRYYPHAPDMKDIRYLSNGGGVENQLVAALRFENEFGARNAMYRRGVELARVHQGFTSPPQTTLDIIECSYKKVHSVTVAEIIAADLED